MICKHPNPFLLLAIAGMLALMGSPVRAQLMIDQAIGGAIGGGSEIGSIPKAPSAEMILYNLQKQGYTNISGINPTTIGTPTQITATSPAGIPVNIAIDPATGKVLSALPQ